MFGTILIFSVTAIALATVAVNVARKLDQDRLDADLAQVLQDEMYREKVISSVERQIGEDVLDG